MNKKLIIIICFLILCIIILFLFFKFIGKNEDESSATVLYNELIDKYLQNSNIKNYNYDYILISDKTLIDPLSGKELSKNAKDTILNYCEKYSNIVTFEEKQDKNLNGIKINFSISKKEKNTTTINIKYSILNSNSIGGCGYICTYKNNKWNIELDGNMWNS